MNFCFILEGGGVSFFKPDNEDDAQFCEKLRFTCYMVYDPQNMQKYKTGASIKIGNASVGELKEIWQLILAKNKRIQKILKSASKKCIKVGVTADVSSEQFKKRMRIYNDEKDPRNGSNVFDYVDSSKFFECVLAKSGDEFLLGSKKRITLTSEDIRLLEIVAITSFKYGEQVQFSQKCLNISYGGETISGIVDTLYWRAGERREGIGNKEKKKRVDKEVPLNPKGNYDWAKILPESKITARMGVEFKRLANEKLFECPYCSAKFTLESSMNGHIAASCPNAPDNEKVRFACPIANCGSTFAYEGGLRHHMKTFHDGRELSRLSLGLQKAHQNPQKRLGKDSDEENDSKKTDKNEEGKGGANKKGVSAKKAKIMPRCE